jgi:hypothetical protein
LAQNLIVVGDPGLGEHNQGQNFNRAAQTRAEELEGQGQNVTIVRASSVDDFASALNRLISAQNTGTDCTATVLGGNKKFWGNNHGYDAWGNLLSKSVTKCSAENLSVVAGNNNRLTGAYLYDAPGNMTHDATSGLNYTFDQENRLTGAAGYTYTYDGDGSRVRKSNGNLAANGTLYWDMTPGVVAETDLAGLTPAPTPPPLPPPY